MNLKIKKLASIVVIAAMSVVSSYLVADTTATPSSPNIILVLADDMSWFDVGAYHQAIDYAPKNAITPNIDKIAEEGMMFTRSFTATAMCAVTRQQLYTGIYPVRNGAYGNHTRVYDGVKSAVHYFRDMGYRVGLAGKGHIFPKQAFPFERVGRENKGPEGESSFGIEQTRKFMARNKEQPFFLVVASANPHGPWNRGDIKQYPKDKLEIPVFLNDTPGLRHRLSQYLAEVTDLDREVGLLEAEIEKLGIKNETIFIFTSEQGSSLPFGKWTNYDSGLQTAFIIRW
ncbi:MAG: sulfatase-like hydrolase/transferase, partial [Cycloclasticus pugetii]